MTIAELNRKLESYRRLEKIRAKEKATFDYSLATLIGRAFGASEQHPFPDIFTAYPAIFEDEIKKAEEDYSARQAELAKIRFLQFAESHNRKHNRKLMEDSR